MTTDPDKSAEGELTELERYLLTHKGCTEFEIEVIERSILGRALPGDEDCMPHARLMEQSRSKAAGSTLRSAYFRRLLQQDAEPAEQEPDLDSLGEEANHFADADRLRESFGLASVLETYADFFVCVEDTNYTFRDWHQIHYAFVEMELTPLPSKEEIEKACGPAGLNLPCVLIDGTCYFDFELVARDSAAKIRRASEHRQAREEVLRYLVGDRIDLWEDGSR